MPYKRKNLFRDLQTVLLSHAADNDKGLSHTMRDAIVTLRQIADVRKISFTDVNMDASEKYARMVCK